MRCRIQNRPQRIGFTLVELMVAMALIIFIMYVLAEAFSAGAKTFRDLKGIGDMNERLRTATSILRQYLAADHFEGRKRLSDPNFWAEGPPRQGFFRIWQDHDSFDEGDDLDSDPGVGDHNKSFRTFYDPSRPNEPVGHHLHFTVRLRGDRLTDFFRATVPGNSPLLQLPEPALRYQEPGSDEYRSQWAEVAVFLKRTGEQTEDPNPTSGSPLELYSLHLQQRLLVPSNKDVQDSADGAHPWPVPASEAGQYSEVSQITDPRTNTQLYFNGADDVTMPGRRSGNANHDPAYPVSPGALARDPNGSDVLLTDVLSFDVRVLLDQEAYTGTAREEFITLYSSHLDKYRMMVNGQPATSGLDPNVRVFDTWSSRKDDAFDYTLWNDLSERRATTIPMFQFDSPNPIRIKAIKITIRMWDSKTKQSRQVSMVQDL